MTRRELLPDEEWTTIVQNVPIVSVDLVVQHGDGVVLGKRTNRPAKGEWFVPGGRVVKHERLEDAVNRVAREEVGVDVTIDRRLGVYEHFYDVAEIGEVRSKHYIPIAYKTSTTADTFEPDDQHSEMRTFAPPFDFELHPYVRDYLTDAGIIEKDDN